MSYILDALKKAERERGKAQVPTLSTVHDPGEKSAPSYRFLAVSVLALLAVGLVVTLLLWNRGDRSAAESIAYTERDNRPGVSASETYNGSGSTLAASPAEPNQSRNEEFASSEVMPSRKIEPATANSVPSPSSVRRSARSDSRIPAGDDAAATVPPRILQQPPIQESESAARSEPEVRMESSPPLSKQPSESAGSADIGGLSSGSAARESALHAALKDMKISILLYAENPADRLVFINGRKYVEGDTVDGRFLLEEITRNGALLSYDGVQALLQPEAD